MPVSQTQEYKNVRSWIAGASSVNSPGIAPFGDFVRQFTLDHVEIRTGAALLQGQFNFSSNQIALSLLNTIITGSGSTPFSLPDIEGLGAIDAGSGAQLIFGSNYSPWAGTVLFANLGTVSFLRDWLIPTEFDETVTGSVNGASNQTFKAIPGAYDLFSTIEAFRSSAVTIAIEQLSLPSAFDIVSNLLNSVLNLVVPPDINTAGQFTAEVDVYFKRFYDLNALIEGSDSFLPGDNLPLGKTLFVLEADFFEAGTVGVDSFGSPDDEFSTFRGGLHLGPGNDTVLFDAPTTLARQTFLVDGGDGRDSISFETDSTFRPSLAGLRVEAVKIAETAAYPDRLEFTSTNTEHTGLSEDAWAYVYSVESITLTAGDDEVILDFIPVIEPGPPSGIPIRIDAGPEPQVEEEGSKGDTLNFSDFRSAVSLDLRENEDPEEIKTIIVAEGSSEIALSGF